MAHISEILSLTRFDSASEHKKERKDNKQQKHYSAVRVQTKAESITQTAPHAEALVSQEIERRKGGDRRLDNNQRNKRFDLRNKKDRRKSTSISITA